MSWAVQAQRAWQARTSEELARTWIAAMVERTPLAELDDLAIGWLGREAAPLIAALLDELNGARPAPGPLPAPTAERARGLVAVRGASNAAAEVPRDLAVLQGLLAEALARNGGADGGEPDLRQGELVRLFGELHSEFAQALLAERPEAGGRDALADLEDEPAMHEALGRLVVEGGAGGRPFSVMELDVDGLRHLNSSRGHEAGDGLLRTVADAAREAIGPGGRLFRRADDELLAVLPGSEGPAAAALAARVREAVGGALGGDGLRAPVSIGVAAWPAHAGDPAQLLERAREAIYVAKSSGHGIALSNGAPDLQRS